MEKSRFAGLVELDGASMAAVSGGTLIPSSTTSFWYDVAWAIGYGTHQFLEGVAAYSAGAGSGGYAYAKVGTY